ncbi:SnoaL-like domain-containing protein [Mycolicibacterium fluoranthenivorans]|jgi:hypothetical protein|uniref:SnoaL-like domain-containing protein n=2 Tax=Mycolicibacterium fluoranthenivorans TaxID=258505 RepID=A0A1G4W657_9MYCO|nr:SnoaL-like domain-containing protein [Mycolicibacterium fluoranthenivorans]
MPVEDNCLFSRKDIQRRIRQGAVAVGTAVMMLGGVNVPMVNADPLPLPSLCGYSSPGDDSGVEVDAIKALKATYFASIDAKNWDGLRDLLDPNVVEDTTCSAGPILYGRDAFISFLKLTLGGATTHHQGSDPHIKVNSATTASGLWTLEDVLVFGGTLGVHGYGHYNDTYVKTDGKWVVKTSKLTRTRIDLINPANGAVIQSDASLLDVAAKVKAIVGG